MEYVKLVAFYSSSAKDYIYVNVPIYSTEKQIQISCDHPYVKCFAKYRKEKLHIFWKEPMLSHSEERFSHTQNGIYVKTVYPNGIETTPHKINTFTI